MPTTPGWLLLLSLCHPTASPETLLCSELYPSTSFRARLHHFTPEKIVKPSISGSCRLGLCLRGGSATGGGTCSIRQSHNFPHSVSHPPRSTTVPEKRRPRSGQSAAHLGKKFHLIVIFLSYLTLCCFTVVSFRPWSRIASKALYFQSGRSDTERGRAERAQARVQADLGSGMEGGGRGRACLGTGGRPVLPPPTHPPFLPPTEAQELGFSLLLSTPPSPTLRADFHFFF